ncbi:aldose 1-epimerase family protein [Romboutsia weinsteinii]|uniref:Aldose 1-epimerase family protein n=1 Tax=Romboutsia weinsteinii TaxID=2020949 RepID=A0A371J0C2_9FIRM|nr:aldose 1-epimerase family protein [Romboutsia weinsteinii]RDY26118.1 aldose 1-epimerase family protein [Romboutsia weinsteinii]
MHILQNEHLIIESKNSGAELTRIFCKKQNKEILWSGDSKYWGRQSPILFPIVGKLKDNTTIIEDCTYTMGQHGFARDLDFELIQVDNNSVSYRLVSSETTHSLYPYDFELLIKYTLIDSEVRIDWNVVNKDSKEMYFSIGAHPAFNIDNSLSDYYLEFKSRDNISQITLNGPYSDKDFVLEKLNTLLLNPDLFANDALIYTNIDEITIKNNKDESFVNVNFTDFPLVGIWTPYYKDSNSTAPFLCIEPWYGLADSVDSDGQYKNKKYINTLDPSECFSVSYSISVG